MVTKIKNLRDLRIKAGYSQAQIADFLQIGNSTAFRMEKGMCHPTLAQIITLCKVLDCTPAQLYGLQCDADDCRIPVFDLIDKTVDSAVSYRRGDISDCHFGIVLDRNISDRFSAGDICFFVLDAAPHPNDLVIYIDGNLQHQIRLYDGTNARDVAAVCKNMRRKM